MDAPSAHDVLVLIPALNEEATVASVVDAARNALGCDVLVIDDGSTDHTEAKALAAGAMVISHPFNLGVGAAIRTGIRVAASQHRHYVVQLDADGQHEATEAARLLELVRSGEADLVVGSRFAAGYHVSHARRAMMRLLSRVVSRRIGVEVDDTTSGFRAFGPRAVELFSHHYPTQYLSDTVEALLIAAGAGLRIRVEPVHMHERQGGAPSSGHLRSIIDMARMWVVILLHPVRRPADGR